jgi:ATP-binding cassette subfamily B protein
MCFVTQYRLAWIFVAIIPVLLFLLLFIASRVHPIFVKVFNKYDSLNRNVQEDVDGIRVVKSFDRAKYQDEKFYETSDFIYRHFVKAERILAFNAPIMNTAIYAAIIAICYFGSWLIINYGNSETVFTTGGLTTFITYVMMIMMSLMMISMIYVTLTISRNSSERICEILNEVPDITSPENAISEIKNGNVDFDDVTFEYVKDKPVLSNINIHIKSGQSVGIVGSTGSSKSTLVSLMARLYDVTSGDIRIGDEDVRKYDLKALRDNVSVVLQKNTLFTGTIRSNLLWGNEDATDEEMWEALDIAQASEFVKALPKGLDSPISEGGTNVSGGQKQRLCIARALLKNPKILILDDSTSACDTHTDKMIREGLVNYRKDVTKFIISQRVLSIKDCDHILVMDKGNIVAQGSNDELMRNCDVYQELYQSQLGGGDFDAAN